GLEEVKRDIEEYNPGLYIQNTPIWLILAEIRKEKAAGTILLAFKTRGEATKAVRNHLFVGGVSCKAAHAKNKLRPTIPPKEC
ncbi:hypothetical protein CERZMDRAFT_52194, partial [Cercospora zeae-maydis SCOH1-5]